MKRKALLISLAVALVAMMALGVTLAYFTDKDQATNTFTVGNVKIKLIEQQRNSEGTELEAFKQDKKLMPIVGSAQGEKDGFGLPTAANYVDKVVTVKNTGNSAAYIRAYFAIPSALDDGYETFNAGLNVLHFNFGNKMVDGAAVTTFGKEWIWKTEGEWNYFETKISGIDYNVYYADYATSVAAGASTERFVDGVYLDKSVDFKANGKMMAFDEELTLDFDIAQVGISCPVAAIACQAEGFANANAAFAEAFGADFNPFA